MFGLALRDGLRGWARAPFKAVFATAVTLGLLVLAYAVTVQASLEFWASLGIWALLANLSLGGWGLFCAGQVAGDGTRWTALLAGFRRPLALTAAGLVAAALVLAPTFVAGYVTAFANGPDWLTRVFVLLVICVCAPAGVFMVLDAASGGGATGAVVLSLTRAYRRWLSLSLLALLTIGLAAAGVVPGLLLERHALPQIGALLPSNVAEFDLAIVRLVALLGGLASISAAGCIWAAAWRASREARTIRQTWG